MSKQAPIDQGDDATKPAENATADFKRPSRLIVGYTGTIPTKFRQLSEKEIQNLLAINFDEIYNSLNNSILVEPSDFRRLLKIIVAKGEFSKLSLIPSLLDRFPQFTPMFVDLLIKRSGDIPEGTRNDLRLHFSRKLKDASQVSEYILISISRLLGSSGFESKEDLLALFRSLRRNAGAYVGRSVIDALLGICSRNEVLEIREYFDRADLWEKRAIIRLVDWHLPEAEKRPWLKNIKLHMADDHFAVESFEPSKLKKKKKN